MKVELKSASQREPNYPYIGRSKIDGEIVLFSEKDTGISLAGGKVRPGHLTDGWDEKLFIPFDGSVVLSNS